MAACWNAPRLRRCFAVLLLLLLTATAPAHAAGSTLSIQRLHAPITIDGELDDAGWKDITPVTQWYETRVNDNAEPQVKTEGWMAYDEKYFYVALRAADPNPKLIRAPISDHDNLSGNTDYGGVILDTRNDGKTAVMFLANPNGLLYDALTNDATGEDSSPDFFWEAKGKITAAGWQLEIRVPFSALRYSNADVQQWGVMLYRNYPRERHYQFFSSRQPRESNCFICNENKLEGLEKLPHGSHLVLAPYSTTQRIDEPTADLGSPLSHGEVKPQYGADLKWSPFATMAFDATVKPDFSQVEGDAAQIGANERFALFYPEKRSFFLEGIDLFSTPLQAVYTRSINAPEGGVRATGRAGNTSYTALVARDRGQGLVILPGAEGSDAAIADYWSDVGIVRMKHDLGRSSVSLLATGRTIDGGGSHALAGPDFEWRRGESDVFTGQALFSHSETPNRPDLTPVWDGRTLEDPAFLARWQHGTRTTDFYLQGQHVGKDFRADEGFMPQVGFRELYAEGGYTIRPKKGFLSRMRVFANHNYDETIGGTVLARTMQAGAGMDGKFNSFARFEFNRDEFKVGDRILSRVRPYIQLQASPGRIVNNVSVSAHVGDEIDFANAREGHGVSMDASTTLHPNDHLDVQGTASVRWVNVDDPVLGSGRVFLAQVERVRAAWSFSSRSFIRLIGQYVDTKRDVALYTFEVPERDAGVDFSALFAYKLDWQTVMYLGYGDQRAHAENTGQFEPSGRQMFAKISYAWQH